ncbi:hypothetical protein OAB00_01465 [Akkermansiaceae bacterium]|nr:hypothetical protein [Akkermansiaceae bacterium]
MTISKSIISCIFLLGTFSILSAEASLVQGDIDNSPQQAKKLLSSIQPAKSEITYKLSIGKKLTHEEASSYLNELLKIGVITTQNSEKLLADKDQLTQDLKKHFMDFKSIHSELIQLSEKKQFNEVIEWIETLHFEFLKYEALSFYFKNLVESGVEITPEMETIYKDIYLNNAVKLGLSRGYSEGRLDFPRAIEAAQEITNENIRLYAIANIMTYWLGEKSATGLPKDRAAATVWYEQTDTITDAQRTLLNKKVDSPLANEYPFTKGILNDLSKAKMKSQLSGESIAKLQSYLEELLQQYSLLGADNKHPNYLDLREEIQSL